MASGYAHLCTIGTRVPTTVSSFTHDNEDARDCKRADALDYKQATETLYPVTGFRHIETVAGARSLVADIEVVVRHIAACEDCVLDYREWLGNLELALGRLRALEGAQR